MLSKSTTLGVAGLLAIAPMALAQQPVYAQCGGINWTGGTTCVSGSTCVKSNDYYSQCLPGSGGVTTTSKPTTTVKPTTTGPSVSTSPTGTATSSAPASTSTDNPYVGYSVYLSPYYAAEIKAAVATIKDSTLAAKAAKVANIPTFTWLDTIDKVPTLETYLADAKAQQTSTGKKMLVQIVVYDLPDRDCHAKASNGELSIANGGVAAYKSQYIDAIATIIKKYPDIRIVAVVEPDSLANIVTNLSDPKCSNAQTAYKECVSYAVKTLSQPNVYLYLDAGHAGWLGWTANIQPAAQMFGSILTQAGGQYRVRGLATNVANYNALNAASPDPITQGNSNYDENHYINALAPLLTQYNYPAHFIVDQGRSGVQNIRSQWGDWCNIKGAGFGTQPTTATGNSYIDSIVWVKPGGESDGTSNTTSARYDSTCGLSDATQPAPEAGTWFEAYFETLVSKANPAI
ncbi:glycoside hydrolase family 6 protein [Ceratobasidium sp. AG-Ba]|nr:glycoside hydrolase family 6 protein [Ceratobasidium sp. AG-Ba]